MRTIVVASKNPVKVAAIREGFGRVFVGEEFEVTGVSVPSGVGDQPMDDVETLAGSMTRVRNAAALHPEADFVAGIEGGIEDADGEMEAFAWIVIRAKDGRIGKGRTGTFFLPRKVAELVRQGTELGKANDIVFGMENSKQGLGACGILTHGVIDRATYYSHATVLALVAFTNGDLYA